VQPVSLISGLGQQLAHAFPGFAGQLGRVGIDLASEGFCPRRQEPGKKRKRAHVESFLVWWDGAVASRRGGHGRRRLTSAGAISYQVPVPAPWLPFTQGSGSLPPNPRPAMKPEDLTLMRSLPMFGKVTAERLAALVLRGSLQRYPRGTLLFREGDQADFLMVLLEGGVELFACDHDENEAVVETLFPVDSFILAAALTGAPYLMSARTLLPSRVLLLDAEIFRRTVATDPDLSAPVMAELAQHFRRLVRQIKDLKLRTGAQRLGCYVLSLAASAEEVVLPFDKRTLASRLGMTAENLSRAFSALRGHGLSIRGSHLLIQDRERLAAFARPDPLIDTSEGPLSLTE
jgi:CRP/FNR family transcriptional regulator, transcriptional activator FtrB